MSAQSHAQAQLFRGGHPLLVDEVRRGWVLPYEGGTVRVHGRTADGAFLAAKADLTGRDLRPLTFITLPSDHPRLKVPPK